MGILDWFKNRPAQFDPDRVSEALLRGATDKAITLANPRLRVLPACHSRLAPAVGRTIEFLRAMVGALPEARRLSATSWSADPAWRAFFVAPADIPAVLGRCDKLRTLFAKFPELDEACVVLGMTFNEQRSLGIALQGELVQRDVVQTSVSFADHRTQICGRSEARLRRLIGAEAFEYLLGRALAEIGENRLQRQGLEAQCALLRSRLRLLQQQGPGLGSLFGSPPAARSEQARLEGELLDNERQLETVGDSQSALEIELECLKDILDHPERHLCVANKQLRVDAMNLVVDPASGEAASAVDFSTVELGGSPPRQWAFVLARVGRSDVPAATGIDFDAAARYL